ncbi:DUF427-domain-containing protein [Aureobasidium sp. EXF-10727]|nr:DUF427-domain-containing protein [Aureobasidium sp. EXF-10727]
MLDPRTFPRPPALQQIKKNILIKFPGPDGPTIASTDRAYWVLETYHPPTYYLPPASIKLDMTPTSRRTFCEWKGAANYFTFKTPAGDLVDSRAWTYNEPTPTFTDIKGYVSFYADPRWECYVDGELVEAQPGDFYGGWMTSDIVRKSVKGAPGTRGW